jgi:regulator of protease activity HflC (stomatin/prohibitin superfamily)
LTIIVEPQSRSDAHGHASAIIARAEASAASLELVAKALEAPNGEAAARLAAAERWLEALGSGEGGRVVRIEMGEGRGVIREAMQLADGRY